MIIDLHSRTMVLGDIVGINTARCPGGGRCAVSIIPGGSCTRISQSRSKCNTFRFSNRSTIGIIYNGSQDTAHMDGWGTGVVEGKIDCC